MPLSESDTRAKLIDPAIHKRGWTEELIRREETAGGIERTDEGPQRRPRGRIDYLLRNKVTKDSQPVAVALIEAKAEHLPPTHGLEQAKLYAACKRQNLPFALPPLPEQKRIAAKKLRESIEAQLKELNVLPSALLRKAFNEEL